MHTPQVITSGVDYIFLIVPVVVVLFGWIGAVYWANAHPDVRRPGEPGRAIAGQAGPGATLPDTARGESTLASGAADEHQAARLVLAGDLQQQPLDLVEAAQAMPRNRVSQTSPQHYECVLAFVLGRTRGAPHGIIETP